MDGTEPVPSDTVHQHSFRLDMAIAALPGKISLALNGRAQASCSYTNHMLHVQMDLKVSL